jgi:hypothetical protein
MKLGVALLSLAALLTLSGDLESQELEPRRWAHLPIGMNFIGLGSDFRSGDINFDPALRIEDAEFEVAGVGLGYIRSFDLLGKSARIDVSLPYAAGRWQGLLDGEPASVRRRGFADARMRLSVNLIGAPVLKGPAYAQFRAENPVNTTVGVALGVILPTGEYREDRLINLGQNRWALWPQIGVLHQRKRWEFELTGSVGMFGDNDEFFQGTKREQDPLWFVQGHIIYTFRPGLWSSLSGGFGHGGRSVVDGMPKGDDSRSGYWKLSMGVPIDRRQGLNFSIATVHTNTRFDADYLRFAVNWSLMFGL